MDLTDDQQLAAHLEELECALLSPQSRTDTGFLASILTDAFREFGSSGRVYTKADIPGALASESPSVLSLSEFRCQHVSTDVALVTYRSHRQPPDGPATTALRSSLWLRTSAGWQLHFHQGTTEPSDASTI